MISKDSTPELEGPEACALVKLNDAMVGAGATILRNRFQEIGPYSAKHLAAEIFTAMQAMATGCRAGKVDA
jgi:hypothetical protein